MTAVPGTKVRALAEAKSLLQTYGFNGFSFQHVADALGIKKPSLYVHFASKEEMGNQLIEDYSNQFVEWAKTLNAFEPEANVRSLFDIFQTFSMNGRQYCPLAALIGDFNSLPVSMQKNLRKAFKIQQKWLRQIIEDGQSQKVFSKKIDSEEASQSILAMALGSQQVSRVLGQPERIHSVADDALAFLSRT